ncbi:MAG: type I methionyl aminopeptidase [Patescibacteria group bacterium]
MIEKKTPAEIALMREGGQRLAKILETLLSSAKVGTPLLSLDKQARELIKQAGGSPSFPTVAGYQWATCLCVNEVVVHGIPTPYELREGDLLTIDIGMLYQGFHTDTAWTKVIQNSKFKIQNLEEKERFLQAGREALTKAIAQVKPGNRVGHISQAIQSTIEKAGFSVVRSLVGHGVGRKLHEEPQVPGFLRGELEKTPLLLPGMTLAVEIIYAQGSGAIVYENDDGWTLATRDQTLSAVFEHTVAVTEAGPLVLTEK